MKHREEKADDTNSETEDEEIDAEDFDDDDDRPHKEVRLEFRELKSLSNQIGFAVGTRGAVGKRQIVNG